MCWALSDESLASIAAFEAAVIFSYILMLVS
jgi:putative flippase GtrA